MAKMDKVYEHMFRTVEELLRGVERRVGELDPALVLPSAADRLVGLFAWGAKLCLAAVCVLAARAAEQIHPRNGGVLPAEHLARQLGCTVGDARRILEASAHLGEAPETRAELLAGKISALQAADIISARREAEAAREREERRRREQESRRREEESRAQPSPEPPPCVPPPSDPASPEDVERRLLDDAEGSSATSTRKAAEKERAAARDEETQRRYAHRNRCWRKRAYEDGLVGGEYRLPPEVAADVNARIEEKLEELFDEARRAGVRDSREAYGADALSMLLAGVRSHDPDAPAPPPPPEPEPAPASKEPAPAPARPSGPSPVRLPGELIVRVDLAALLRGQLGPGELCEIPGVGPYPLSAVRAALGHGALVNLVLTEGRDVRSIVCGGRNANKALRLAISEQYPFCCDCGSRFRLERDHHQPVALDGLTSFDNLKHRCHRCHDAKSRREARVTQAAGRRKAAERRATAARSRAP